MTHSATPRKYEGDRTPALERLAGIADAIGEKLRRRVAFIGGSILPLLQTDHQVFGSPRPTKDVDGVVLTQRYTDKANIEQTLRDLRFRHEVGTTAHADRWKAPDGTMFDLVSCGEHLGGTGNEHDLFAIETAVSLHLPPSILHASAVAFMLLKCGAFRDRGSKAPLQSKDLMDIVVLTATRSSLPNELAEAPEEIQDFVREMVQRMLNSPLVVSAIPTHIADRDPLADDVEERVIEALRTIATDGPA